VQPPEITVDPTIATARSVAAAKTRVQQQVQHLLLRELGISRLGDVAPGTGWRQGILAPGKLQLAVTRDYNPGTNIYDLVEGAQGKIDFDTLDETKRDREDARR
jgi:hypothetical protein